MTELHVLQEVQGLRHGDIAVCLEQHHGNRLSGKHVTNHKLSQDVEAKLGIGDTLDHSDGDKEDEGQKHGDDHCPPGEVGIPDEDGDQRQGEQNEEECVVPPVRGIDILLHHLEMDVCILVPRHLPALDNLRTVKDGGMHDDGRESTERDTVCEREEGPQEQRRVLLVRSNVKDLVGGEDPGDIIRGSSVVKRVRLICCCQMRLFQKEMLPWYFM